MRKHLTSLVLALVACGDGTTSPGTGSVEITTVTSGLAQDQNGYQLEVDDAPSLPIGRNGLLTLTGVPAGEVEIGLLDVRGNCTVHGQTPHLVDVRQDDTVSTIFYVNCDSLPLRDRIAFASDRDRDTELYTMNPDGSDQRRLTETEDNEFYPSISPDGTRILYTWSGPLPSGGYGSEIHVMDVLGTVVNLGNGEMPAWSPDGSHIAFVINEDIWVMNVDGTGRNALTATAVSETNPVWSPGSSRILFAGGTDAGTTHLEIMNADGTGRGPLTDDPGVSTLGVWSPDGSRIAFLGDEGTGLALYTMNEDGSDRVRLTPEGMLADGPPSWSPDGRRLAFESSVAGYQQVFVIGADGTGMTNISEHASNEELGPQAWGR